MEMVSQMPTRSEGMAQNHVAAASLPATENARPINSPPSVSGSKSRAVMASSLSMRILQACSLS